MARHFECGISVLAGGLSSRMGEDKARLRIGRRTLLGHVRALARAAELPLRVIQDDVVDRCGPLGGLYTSLQSSRRDAELFLACDMPFVSLAWLKRVLNASKSGTGPVFTLFDGMPGFPCLLPVSLAGLIEDRIEEGRYSLKGLSAALKGACLDVPATRRGEFLNVNTPGGLEEARRLWARR